MLVETRRQSTMTGKKIRPIRRGAEVERCRAGLTDAVQAIDGDGLKGAAHHGVLFQHLVEVVDGEGEESAVRVSTYAGCPPPFGQQADLCGVAGGVIMSADGGKKRSQQVNYFRINREMKQCGKGRQSQA